MAYVQESGKKDKNGNISYKVVMTVKGERIFGTVRTATKEEAKKTADLIEERTKTECIEEINAIKSKEEYSDEVNILKATFKRICSEFENILYR